MEKSDAGTSTYCYTIPQLLRTMAQLAPLRALLLRVEQERIEIEIWSQKFVIGKSHLQKGGDAAPLSLSLALPHLHPKHRSPEKLSLREGGEREVVVQWSTDICITLV